MKITLIRHAEVQEKYKNKYNGHINIGLSKRGEAQAKELAKHFLEKEFDRVYSSDLKRAIDTLKEFKQSKNAIYTSKLREKSWGEYEGLGFDEIISQGKIKYETFTQWIEALGGEPYKDYIDRINEFFFKDLASLDVENILIITHSGVIKTLISIVKNLSLEEAFGINVPYSGYIEFDTNSMSFSEVKCKLG
jgi:alpha-ribazole phosphatase/probable phosphoglycerate mutase